MLDRSGRLYLHGRSHPTINIAGRKATHEEIEEVLKAHPKVREAAVVGCQDRYGEQMVKAIIVPRSPCETEELLAFCRERLAGYKVPRAVEFRASLPEG